MSLSLNWPEWWGMFRKANPESKYALAKALHAEGFDEWMRTCDDTSREKALTGAPVEISLTFIGFFTDKKNAQSVALQYDHKFHGLLSSMWQDNSKRNLEACLLIVRRM